MVTDDGRDLVSDRLVTLVRLHWPHSALELLPHPFLITHNFTQLLGRLASLRGWSLNSVSIARILHGDIGLRIEPSLQVWSTRLDTATKLIIVAK